ncbi:MAG: DUF5777 family beta-barrel protein [Thermoanaerobaculia bacterium]
MTKTWLALALLALAPVAATAQDEEAPRARPLRIGDHYINMPAPKTLAKGAWEIRFTHRFSQSIDDGDEHTFWGLDSPADIGFGLSYAPVDRLQFSVMRTDVLDDYEIAAKYEILRQERGAPLSLAARAGGDWRTERDLDEQHDGVSPFAQLIVSRLFGERFEVFAVPSYAGNAFPFDDACNMPVGVAVRVQPALSLIVELTPENGDTPDDIASDFGWSVGLKRAIGGHFFEVILSNTRATHVDQYVAGGGVFGGLDSGDIRLGFNIERRFGR